MRLDTCVYAGGIKRCIFSGKYSSNENKACLLTLIIALMSFGSCRLFEGMIEAGDVAILLKDGTDYELASFVADGLNSGFSYPDTLLPASLNTICMRVHISDSAYICGWSGRYKDLAFLTQKDTLSIYIFKQDNVPAMGREEIC